MTVSGQAQAIPRVSVLQLELTALFRSERSCREIHAQSGAIRRHYRSHLDHSSSHGSFYVCAGPVVNIDNDQALAVRGNRGSAAHTSRQDFPCQLR